MSGGLKLSGRPSSFKVVAGVNSLLNAIIDMRLLPLATTVSEATILLLLRPPSEFPESAETCLVVQHVNEGVAGRHIVARANRC